MIVIIKKHEAYSIYTWADKAGSYSTQGSRFES